MAVTGNIVVDFNLTDKRTIGLAVNVQANPRINPTITYSDGTGQGQANGVYGVQRTFSGTTDVIDVNALLTDTFGGLLDELRLKGLVIYNPAANGPLVVGAGSNPITSIFSAAGTITIKPDGVFCLATSDATGYAVTAGTADTLTITGTNGQSYLIGFLGANA